MKKYLLKNENLIKFIGDAGMYLKLLGLSN